MSVESVKTEVAPVEQAEQARKEEIKELNFERLRQEKARAVAAAQEAIAEKESLRAEIEKIKTQTHKMHQVDDEEEIDDEPYVNRKGLKKVLSKFGQNIESQIEERAQAVAKKILEEERQKNFVHHLKSEYRDFSDVVTSDTLAKLEQANPRMAQIIDRMPDGFEKGQMVYETIKTMGLHKKPEASVKEKVEANQRNPFYHPSSAGTGAHALGDFSDAGKKAAYDKIKAIAKGFRG